MNSIELLCYLTEKKVGDLFEAARKLPPDKLDWKPAPGARSALDQLQEVATAPPHFADAHLKRKVEWNDDNYKAWMADRQQYTDIDTLEQVCRKNFAAFIESIKDLNEGELNDKVELPFPGEFNLADILIYHYWNASYHEGQITYIGTLLG